VKLWFETHATSVDNERGIASGHIDAALSATGERQARQLGERYAERRLAAVYSSDLQRAAQTADLAFAGRGVPLVRDARLRECDYGEWSGCAALELEAARPRFIDERFPGGESYRDVVRRVAAFLAGLRRGELLVVGHRATWYAFEHLLAGGDLRDVVAAPWRWQPGWEYEI
jgi:broad specificity phosphatase PhoE